MSLVAPPVPWSHLYLVVIHLDAALGDIGIRRLAVDVLALLNHGKLLCSVNGLDLVPSHGYIARHVAMKGHAAAGLVQELTGQLIAIRKHQDIRSRRSGSGGLCVHGHGEGKQQRGLHHSGQSARQVSQKTATDNSEFRHMGTFHKGDR